MPITSGQRGEDADNEEDTDDAEEDAIVRGGEIDNEDADGDGDEGLRSVVASFAR